MNSNFNFQETLLNTDNTLKKSVSKLIDFLEWVFGLNSSKKERKNYSSWIVTLFILLACTFLAIYNQLYHLNQVSLNSWKILIPSVSNYEHVISQLEEADLAHYSIDFSPISTPLDISQLPKNTLSFESLYKNVTQVTQYFEKYPPKDPEVKRLSIRFFKSRNRLIVHYSQFFEHTSIYNSYLTKFPHRFYPHFFEISPVFLYTLKQNFDVKLIVARHD